MSIRFHVQDSIQSYKILQHEYLVLAIHARNALGIIDRLHGVLAIEVRSDHIRIILVQHGSANHDFTVRLMLPQQPDRLFHAGHSGGHKGA